MARGFDHWMGGVVAGASATAVVIAALVVMPYLRPTTATAADAGPETVTVSMDGCGLGFRSGPTGLHEITVRNTGAAELSVNLVTAAGSAVLDRAGVVGPGATGTLRASLAPGSYRIQCISTGLTFSQSNAMVMTGSAPADATKPVVPTFDDDLLTAVAQYQSYVQSTLSRLDATITALVPALARGDAIRSRQLWLAAQLDWQRVGAAYGSFGELGNAIGGMPAPGQDAGTDSAFTGLHRIEYGLSRGAVISLVPVAQRLHTDVRTLKATPPAAVTDPATLQLRAHEILEDALRDHLSGSDDSGAGMAYALTAADSEGTRTVVRMLSPALEARRPGFTHTINSGLDVLDAALLATRSNGAWTVRQDVPPAQRMAVNAALSAVLESLADVPQVLHLLIGSDEGS